MGGIDQELGGGAKPPMMILLGAIGGPKPPPPPPCMETFQYLNRPYPGICVRQSLYFIILCLAPLRPPMSWIILCLAPLNLILQI